MFRLRPLVLGFLCASAVSVAVRAVHASPAEPPPKLIGQLSKVEGNDGRRPLSGVMVSVIGANEHFKTLADGYFHFVLPDDYYRPGEIVQISIDLPGWEISSPEDGLITLRTNPDKHIIPLKLVRSGSVRSFHDKYMRRLERMLIKLVKRDSCQQAAPADRKDSVATGSVDIAPQQQTQTVFATRPEVPQAIEAEPPAPRPLSADRRSRFAGSALVALSSGILVSTVLASGGKLPERPCQLPEPGDKDRPCSVPSAMIGIGGSPLGLGIVVAGLVWRKSDKADGR